MEKKPWWLGDKNAEKIVAQLVDECTCGEITGGSMNQIYEARATIPKIRELTHKLWLEKERVESTKTRPRNIREDPNHGH